MKYTIPLLLACLFFSACDDSASRYSLVAASSANGPVVYKIDGKTGEAWKLTWGVVGNPVNSQEVSSFEGWKKIKEFDVALIEAQNFYKKTETK